MDLTHKRNLYVDSDWLREVLKIEDPIAYGFEFAAPYFMEEPFGQAVERGFVRKFGALVLLVRRKISKNILIIIQSEISNL
jgi:hypothetical protein